VRRATCAVFHTETRKSKVKGRITSWQCLPFDF
jgi:hypothetical protein